MKITTEKTEKESEWTSKILNIDVGNIQFDLDALQNELINRYLRQDKRFLQAWFTQYTDLFMQFIKDKVRLNEPITISIMGQTRCQPKGSKVLMADMKFKNIENVKIGDEVISPQKGGTIIIAKVVDTINYFSTDNKSIIDFKTEKILYNCNYNHKMPIYYNQHYVDLSPKHLVALSPTDKLKSNGKSFTTLKCDDLINTLYGYKPILIRFKQAKNSMVYGITIDSPSQWYITDNYMVTHNSGKSVSAITLAGLIMEARKRLMDTYHVLANEYQLLEVLKNPKITHFGDAFVIDESKQAVYGIGSTARKFKLSDIQNIIAVNNISTLWLRPDGWSNEGSQYGLRAFGRGQFYKDGTLLPARINKFMLYNLQESSAGGSLPLGMIYIPHFEDILKNGKELWKEYSDKKQKWVDEEQHGEADTMMTQAFHVAEKIYVYPKFKLLKGSAQKKTFIATALGSESTTGETKQIFEIIKLLEQGLTLDEIKNFAKMNPEQNGN